MLAKNYLLRWIAGRANIFSKYIIYIFFKFGRDSCGSFSMLFPKVPTSCCKRNLALFLLHCTSIFMSSKNLSQIFKILFQTGDINIFVLCDVFVSKCIQQKSSFSDKNHQRRNPRHSSVEKLSKINVAKY